MGEFSVPSKVGQGHWLRRQRRINKSEQEVQLGFLIPVFYPSPHQKWKNSSWNCIWITRDHKDYLALCFLIEMRKLRLRKIKQLVQGHAGTWWMVQGFFQHKIESFWRGNLKEASDVLKLRFSHKFILVECSSLTLNHTREKKMCEAIYKHFCKILINTVMAFLWTPRHIWHI